MSRSSPEHPQTDTPADPSGALLRHRLPVTAVLEALSASFQREVRRLRQSGTKSCREARQFASGLDAQIAVREHRRAADAALLEWIAGSSGHLSIEDLALFKRNHPPTLAHERASIARVARLLGSMVTQIWNPGRGAPIDEAGLHDELVSRMLDLGLLEPDRPQ